MTSWEFFDYLLENAGIVGTPGSGFGPSGEGYFRLTAFGTYENTVAAIERIQKIVINKGTWEKFLTFLKKIIIYLKLILSIQLALQFFRL